MNETQLRRLAALAAVAIGIAWLVTRLASGPASAPVPREGPLLNPPLPVGQVPTPPPIEGLPRGTVYSDESGSRRIIVGIHGEDGREITPAESAKRIRERTRELSARIASGELRKPEREAEARERLREARPTDKEKAVLEAFPRTPFGDEVRDAFLALGRPTPPEDVVALSYGLYNRLQSGGSQTQRQFGIAMEALRREPEFDPQRRFLENVLRMTQPEEKAR